MAKKGLQLDDLNSAVVKEEKKYEGPTVQVFIQPIENSGEEGMDVDQYEHVTISNETGSEKLLIKRGEFVEIPVPFYIALKEKYGKTI